MENFRAIVNNLPHSKRAREDGENKQPEPATDWHLFSRAMLLATSYSLNASCSKMATIGLKLVNGQDFEVAIKLSNRYFSGISLTVAEWKELRAHKAGIQRWLNNQPMDVNDTPASPPTVSLGRQTISFTTAYNAKAIVLAMKETPEDRALLKKAKKAFSPVIVMHQTTFMGLVTLTKCIDLKIEQLLEDIDVVKKFKDTLIAKISVEATMNDWTELERAQVNAMAIRLTKDDALFGYDPAFYDYSHGNMDDKRRLIGAELIGIHHEYIFRKVMARVEEMPS